MVSPWSRGGWVNSQALDHTSVIRFLEARFGVKEPNISPFRRAVLGDLTSSFNFANPDHEALPALAGRKTKGEADALRAAQQALPQRVARSRAGSRRRHGVGAPAQRPQHAIAVLEPTGWWYAT